MKNSPRFILRPSFKARSLFVHSTQLVRVHLSRLLLMTALAWTPALHAQIIGMRDIFNYSASNISGHAPSLGSGTWSTVYTSGSNGAANIAADTTQARITMNGGVVGAGNAVANWAFTPAANTVYTINVGINFTPTGAGAPGCWTAFGFSNATGGGNYTTNPGPWQLMNPQRVTTDNAYTYSYIGHTIVTNGTHTVPAAYFSGTTPMLGTITWNTRTGLAKYYINNVLQSTGTTPLPTGQFYVFFQGFCTGNAISYASIAVAAQSISFSSVEMQDNFTYVSGSLAGQVPTTVDGAGWSTNWTTNNSSATISTSGSQAVILTGSGVPGGGGNALANFTFHYSPNTFYTLRVAFQYNGPIGSGDCWAAYGFSNLNSGGNSTLNPGPWQFIRPQTTSTNSPGTAGYIGHTVVGSGNVPAAAFSAPITATITWNTSTGVTMYYLNDLLQWTGTTSASWTGTTTLPGGQYYAFFQGFQTGTAVNLNTISLTSQQLPLPVVLYTPVSTSIVTTFSNIFESGTTPCSWPTAKNHTNVFCVYDSDFYSAQLTGTQQQTLINYLKANNIKLGICVNPLAKGTGTSCANGEAYDTAANHQTAVNKIVSLGGTVDYLTLDTPLNHGCEPPAGAGHCMLSIDTAAQQTASTIQIFSSVWPNLKVVDLDAFGHIPAADTSAWFAALQTYLGKPLDQIEVDFNPVFDYVDETGTSNPNGMPALQAQCVSAGVGFGLICDGGYLLGNGSSCSPLQVTLDSLMRMQAFNDSTMLPLDTLQVANWSNPPSLPCPETSSTTNSFQMNQLMTSPYALQAPPVALYYIWNNGSYIPTASETEYVNWLNQGYKPQGMLGGIALNPNVGGVSGLVPLYRYYRSANGQYALSLSSNDSTLAGNGFAYQNCQGYVFPVTTGSAAGGCPLYEYYKGATYQYFYSTSSTVQTGSNGYVSDGVKAYILPDWIHYYH